MELQGSNGNEVVHEDMSHARGYTLVNGLSRGITAGSPFDYNQHISPSISAWKIKTLGKSSIGSCKSFIYLYLYVITFND